MSRTTAASKTVTTETRTDRQLRPTTNHKRQLGGVTTLMYAAQQGNVERVKEIIQKEFSTLYDRDRTGKTALHYCCNSDNICAAQGADIIVMAAPDLVDSKDEDGFTPLHLAVIAGNMQLVTFLLANNADVNAVDNEQHTVVHWATVCGETTALRAVLAAGAPVSTPDIHGGYPLHYAAQMCGGDRESSLGLQVLQVLLLDRDISVSVCDDDKRPPLLWAASAGSARAVMALVKAGADIEAADRDGLTALHCAASRGHTDCMDTLLTLCGASIDVIDSNGCTALHYAVTLGHADATTLLLTHGADPNRQDRKGRSPAHCGSAKGQFETVKLIASHKANLWLRNARGDLPLHDAAASGRRELVKWLLELRPSYVNARNNDGRCPLHMAALHDNADMGKILLDNGAQVNPVLRTSKNILMTPLDCALHRGFRSTAKYLQLHGGVPASRLNDSRNKSTNSAVNLQIREDITLLGDTSTDSERENGRAEDRKLNRKKVFSRAERKRISMSGSDVESAALRSERKRRSDTRRRSPSSIIDTAESTRSSAHENTSSSRLGYTNEIIINGKTEINIRQSGEIIFDKERRQSKLEASELEGSKASSLATERDRRPRSAKYSKLKEKSSKKSVEHSKNFRTVATSPETIIQQQDSRKLRLRDQSTNTSEETVDTVIENKKFTSVTPIIAEEGSSTEDKTCTQEPNRVDQQSLISVTSEDAEELRKDLVVEVAVHAPPKSLGNERIQQEDKEIFDSIPGADELEQPSDNKTSIEADQNETIPGDQQIDELSKQEMIVEDKTEQNQEREEMASTEKTGEADIDEGENGPAINGGIIDGPKAEQIAGALDAAHEHDIEPHIEEEKAFGEKVEQSQMQAEIQKHATNSEGEQNIKVVEENGGEHAEHDGDRTKPEEPKEKVQSIKTEAIIGDGQSPKGIGSVSAESKNQLKKSTKEENDLSDIANGARDKKTEDLKGNIRMKEDALETSSLSDDSDKRKSHKSFRVLDEQEAEELDDTRQKKNRSKKKKIDKTRSRSVENKLIDSSKDIDKTKRSRIPKPLFKSTLSKSDKHLDKVQVNRDLETRVPSLPNISDNKHRLKEPTRCESNMSAPPLTAIYSDNERDSASEVEESRDVTKAKRFVKKRSKTREAHSAGSDYESSNVIDSGFEPSPRSTRIPKWRNMSNRGVNMTSVTQNIQNNIRRYHLERKIFQQLLELKRSQIRAGQHNESILVKRAIDAYHQSCASTVGAGRYIPQDFTFKSFEKFLYEALRKLQKNGAEYMTGLPATTQANPLLCTRSTNRCLHAAHAYTGVPCAAYLPRMDHHSIPKIGFNSVSCNPGSGFLPSINPKKAVTLELSHGNDKQIISLPTEKLDENKRYYVTFTVKGHEASGEDVSNNNVKKSSAHRHSRSN